MDVFEHRKFQSRDLQVKSSSSKTWVCLCGTILGWIARLLQKKGCFAGRFTGGTTSYICSKLGSIGFRKSGWNNGMYNTSRSIQVFFCLRFTWILYACRVLVCSRSDHATRQLNGGPQLIPEGCWADIATPAFWKRTRSRTKEMLFWILISYT